MGNQIIIDIKSQVFLAYKEYKENLDLRLDRIKLRYKQLHIEMQSGHFCSGKFAEVDKIRNHQQMLPTFHRPYDVVPVYPNPKSKRSICWQAAFEQLSVCQ